MKYALLIYEAPGSLEALPKGRYEAMFAEYMALSNKSRFLNGARLQPVETATTVRVTGLVRTLAPSCVGTPFGSLTACPSTRA